MKHPRTLTIPVAIFTALALTITACGADSTENTGGSEGEITLDYWTLATPPALAESSKELIQQFEDANPGIKVNAQALPFDQYFQKISIAFASDTAPDVFWVDSTVTTSYGDQGVLKPLDEYLTEDAINDFYPAPLADMTYKGQIQSLALHQSSGALAYLKPVVKAAGVEPPTSYEDSWSWTEMIDAMHKVQDSGIPWGYASTYGVGLYSSYPLVYALGGDVYDADSKQFVGYLDSDATTNAFERWATLHTTEGLAPLDIVPDMLATKKVAFKQTNPFTLRHIQKLYPDLDIGVAPLPCEARCAVASGGYHVGISASTEHADAAWKLVHFLASGDGAAKWIKDTGYLPARKSAFEANKQWLTTEPWSVYWEGLETHAVPRPRTAVYQRYIDEYNSVVEDVARGADAAQELDAAAKVIQNALDEKAQ